MWGEQIELVFQCLESDAYYAKLHCLVCHVANSVATKNIFLLFQYSKMSMLIFLAVVNHKLRILI